MRSRSLIRLIAAGALAIGTLGACGDDSSDDSAEATTTTASDAAQGAGTVSIEMTDYAYAVSGPLTAGDTSALEVTNAGKEFHMAAIFKLKDGKTISDVAGVLSEGGPAEGGEGTATTVAAETTTTAADGGEGGDDPFTALFENPDGNGGTFLSPGQSNTISMPGLAEAGEYALICFLPTEGEGTPHFAKGMLSVLTVTDDGEAADARTPTAAYTIEDGKLEGPETLKAGANVLEITTKGEHDFVVTKLDDGKTFKDLDDYISSVFEPEGEEPPKDLVANSPGDLIGAVLDTGENTTSWLGLDLAPGEYTIACVHVDNDDDDDDGNDVDHYVKEQMTITVN